jgi:hypothetical protein
MANSIALAKKYTALLDEVYKLSALTNVLESDSTLARAGANANEIVVPKTSMDGLADYSRNSGYVRGDVNLTWETKQFNYDRGRMFTVDNMDNEETQNVAFGRLAGEFMRTKVVPELDAFRFAKYASTPNIGAASGALTTGTQVVNALRGAINAFNEAEVPVDGRYLFITPTLRGMIDDLDTTKSKAVLSGFAAIVQVPQTRFYTAVQLNDGTTSGQTGGGYAKQEAIYTLTTDVAIDPTKTYYTKSGDTYTAVTNPDVSAISTYYELTTAAGLNINFLLVHKAAVLQFTKHAVTKIITPDQNQDADAWKYGYRAYGLTDVFDNKAAGIYCHSSNV